MTHKTNKEANNKQTLESHLQMVRKYIGIHQERINEIFHRSLMQLQHQLIL